MIRDLGLAVAEANRQLHQTDSDIWYAISSAEIEVKVAISVSKTTDTEIGGSLGIQAFSVNASYKSTFGFSEEASSTIKLSLQALPKPEPTPVPAAQ